MVITLMMLLCSMERVKTQLICHPSLKNDGLCCDPKNYKCADCTLVPKCTASTPANCVAGDVCISV